MGSAGLIYQSGRIEPGAALAYQGAIFTSGRTDMTVLLRVLAMLALVLVTGSRDAWAQTYPDKPVRVIVPFGAGGPADVFGRVLAQHLQDALKQNFVVENRPGAGAIIGTDAVAKSAPDGYTLLVMSNTHTANESLIPNRPYQLMRDFVPVSPINESDVMMVVNAATGVKTLKEFIALAKAKPGQLNYASSGPGTPYHMAGELFKAMSGTDIVHVPHKTSGDMRTSVLGGHVHMMFDAITVLAPTVQEGKLIALGTSGKARSSVMPEVPTIAEAGVPGYESTIWLGVMAPAKTPQAIVDRLNAEIRKIMARPDITAAWAKQGANPMNMSPAEFEKYLHADIEKWAKVVAFAKLVEPK
jgi:tripartite-type tricarboxylate transporter receptor subunit TctC